MKSRLFLPALLLFCISTVRAQMPDDTQQSPDQTNSCSADMQAEGLCSMQGAGQTIGQPGAGAGAGLGVQGQGQNRSYGNPLTQTPAGYQGLVGNPNVNEFQTSGQPNLQSELRLNLPPEPLTDFQKYVASTTRMVLPIYGASLFRSVPTTFAPLNLGPVPSNYVLGPGDQIRVRVWGQVDFTTVIPIDRSGGVYLPQIGEVHLAGIPASSLEDVLRQAIRKVFRNFDLTATLGQIRSIQVYVVGQARRPGMYTISSLSTLVDALFASGGPAPQGSLRHIEVRRNGQTITDFDLYDLLLRGDKSKDVPLLSGDVIFIPPVGPQAAILGSIHTPAIYELREGETLGQLIKDAGDSSAIAAQSRISIERIEGHKDRAAMEVGFDTAGLGTVVRDGDLVRVFSIVPEYQKTVMLRGNTANPGRFAWHAGMRLSDLIPDRESLVTRNYWWRRTQLGLPAPEFQPLESYPRLLQPNTAVELRQPTQFPVTGAQGYEPGYPGGRQQNQGSAYNAAPGSQLSPQGQSSYGQQGAAAYGLQGANGAQGTDDDGSQGGAYGQQGAYGSQQGPYGGGNNPQNGQSDNRSSLSTQLEVRTENTSGATAPLQVRVPAPDIDWAYAVIERLDPQTLKTKLIPFDLGRLVMDHDPTQNLALQPGDVVSIFSQGDIRVPLVQQTKFVRLEGEFVRAGVYSVKPGETLRQLVKEAGGFTPAAYLYGSEFTRESTRVLQQHRLDEYTQNLDLEIQRGSLAQANSGVASAQDLAAASAAQANERELITQLRQMRATGRIVLQMKPGSKGVDALPDITLEDGDRFVVPSAPAAINVVGAVYDQNSFLYEPQRRVGDYMHLAGGENRDADRKHAFIIRADGSVVSRAMANNVFGNDFESLSVHPGDTIVVPEKTFRPSAIRAVLDYSQLFSQFALGAAALTIIQ